MSLLRNVAHGLRSLFRKEQVDRELDEELGGYLEMAAEEKMKHGYEPQGCASSCPFGARRSRSHEGSRPLCRLGIFCRDVLAGFAPRAACPAQESGLRSLSRC